MCVPHIWLGWQVFQVFQCVSLFFSELPSFTYKLEALLNSSLAASNHASPGQRQNAISGSSPLMPSSPCNPPGQALTPLSTPSISAASSPLQRFLTPTSWKHRIADDRPSASGVKEAEGAARVEEDRASVEQVSELNVSEGSWGYV